MAEMPEVRVPVVAEVSTDLVGGPMWHDPKSWRVVRMVLAMVATIALIEAVILMSVLLVYGVAITQRLAQTDPAPAPAVTECVGELAC